MERNGESHRENRWTTDRGKKEIDRQIKRDRETDREKERNERREMDSQS